METYIRNAMINGKKVTEMIVLMRVKTTYSEFKSAKEEECKRERSKILPNFKKPANTT